MTSPTKAAELAEKLAEFNRYFTSANGVDVGERVSVPRDEWRSLHALLRASEGRVPEGWRLLPVEATREMCAAAVKFANGDAVYKNVTAKVLEIEEGIYAEAYEAMLTAAPHPPAQQAEPAPDMVSREDFDKMSGDLTRAKRLIVDLAKQGDGRVRAMIEARTGTWFVWAQDRDAPPPHKAEGTEQ